LRLQSYALSLDSPSFSTIIFEKCFNLFSSNRITAYSAKV